MTDKEILQLQITACELRELILRALFNARSGHPGGSLSIVEALTYLYKYEIRIDDPHSPDRDRLVLSKGHAVPAQYAVLAMKGMIPISLLDTLRKIDSPLQGHPKLGSVPGIEMSTGSLGQGISVACGMALGAKINHQKLRVYAVLGDGELQEGQVWEAIHFASHYSLNNLCLLVDWNNLQIDGYVDDVMNLRKMDDRFRANGFRTIVIDGHDFIELQAAFSMFHQTKDRPTAVIMKTIKGKGVSYMEDAVEWHGKAPNEEEYKQAILELDQQIQTLRRMDQEGTDVGGTETGGMALGMMDLSDPKWDSMVLDSFARNSLAQRAAAEREMQQRAEESVREMQEHAARQRMMKLNKDTAGKGESI
ncbi:MAG: transketolase [Lachnospiraceae bacterium]|nr:transketolase [Lachnospiraceae bacterium]